MFKFIRAPFVNITICVILIFTLFNCSKDQNSFLPYEKIYLPIPLATNNHLLITGNSILFRNYGVKGVIVVCVNADTNLYYAFDACCPYEKDFSGTVEVEPSPGVSPAGTVYSSAFFGICNKCGSEFNLMGNGQPSSKGPATHYLQGYNISTGNNYLTVTN